MTGHMKVLLVAHFLTCRDTSQYVFCWELQPGCASGTEVCGYRRLSTCAERCSVVIVIQLDIIIMQDRLEVEKTAAADRARNAEASSEALCEQTGKALESVQKQMGDMARKSAMDPQIKEELTRLQKQVNNCGRYTCSPHGTTPCSWVF